MTNVSLSIGGRTYTVACAPGEEDHVGRLGQVIDSTLDTMPNGIAHSETRSLLFAALLLADELHELRNAPAAAPVLPNPAPPVLQGAVLQGPALQGPALQGIATRLERLADLLEQPD